MNPPAPVMTTDLRHWALNDPSRTALVHGSHRASFREIDQLADRLARVFRALGLVRGDHVASLLPNGVMALVVPWACWRAGLYLTPMSGSLSLQDAAYVVADCGARALVVHTELAELAQPLAAASPPGVLALATGGPVTGCADLDRLVAHADAMPIADESPGALMTYTSGTTGRPKGVWRPLVDSGYVGRPPFVADVLDIFGLDEQTRYLSPAPLYHAAPLRFSLSVLAAGGTVFVMTRFDATAALEQLQRDRITHSQWVPTMFQRMLALPQEIRQRFRAPWHRMAFHAAAPCPPTIKRAMIDWWGPILHEYYSGSEGVGLTAISSEEWLVRPGSVGQAKKGVIHVLDEAGQELPPSRSGAVYFSGVTPFTYFNEPLKTTERTSPQGYQTLGDIGYVDDEGYLFLTDRMDDMIISGGVNLYPQEIESALMESPLVLDCGVVGAPDEAFGERAVAFVVPHPRTSLDHEMLVRALETHCALRLGRVKRPAELRIVDAVPRSPTGKLLRRELRSSLSRDGSGQAS